MYRRTGFNSIKFITGSKIAKQASIFLKIPPLHPREKGKEKTIFCKREFLDVTYYAIFTKVVTQKTVKLISQSPHYNSGRELVFTAFAKYIQIIRNLLQQLGSMVGHLHTISIQTEGERETCCI